MRRWTLRHLMASWVAWWTILGGAALGGAFPALWRLSRSSPGSTGEVTGGMSGLELGAKVVLDGVELWTGSVHALAAVAWVVVPPLLLLVLFLRRGTRAADRVLQLGEGEGPADVRNARERVHVER